MLCLFALSSAKTRHHAAFEPTIMLPPCCTQVGRRRVVHPDHVKCAEGEKKVLGTHEETNCQDDNGEFQASVQCPGPNWECIPELKPIYEDTCCMRVGRRRAVPPPKCEQGQKPVRRTHVEKGCYENGKKIDKTCLSPGWDCKACDFVDTNGKCMRKCPGSCAVSMTMDGPAVCDCPTFRPIRPKREDTCCTRVGRRRAVPPPTCGEDEKLLRKTHVEKGCWENGKQVDKRCLSPGWECKACDFVDMNGKCMEACPGECALAMDRKGRTTCACPNKCRGKTPWLTPNGKCRRTCPGKCAVATDASGQSSCSCNKRKKCPGQCAISVDESGEVTCHC